MGGISDYSGGLCLEWPLQQATQCRVSPRDDDQIIARSGAWEHVCIGRDELHQLDETRARARFDGAQKWARYVVGALVILRVETGWSAPCGMDLEIASDVPQGAGVSSSAALEVATLSALNRAFQLDLSGHRIALLAQQVENRVAGAPCGAMDQLTVSLGRRGQLLRLCCQPAIVQGTLAPPDDIEFWGIDSGVKHAVGGGAYGLARCAAFMGRAILAEIAPAALRGPDGELYLANLRPDAWRALRPQIPEKMSGARFLARYEHGDSATTVEPERNYPLRAATEHPIYEADRVARFAQLLQMMDENPAARAPLGRAAGELMIQSHFSYAHRCDLGSAETDILVEMARAIGPQGGIYGAKITGGGAGGTVALMCDRHQNADLESLIEGIAARYRAQTGLDPAIFSGSSDGANVE